MHSGDWVEGQGPGAGEAPERIALVTGAAQGIGRAIAAALLADGHRVALLDRDGEAAAEAARELAAASEARGDVAAGQPTTATLTASESPATAARTLALTADVRDTAQVEAAIVALECAWGPPAILVNNAARSLARPVLEIPLDEWDAVLETNLRRCVQLCQRCAPAMRAAGWGRIVNMTSLAGQQGGVNGGAHYAASKAGMIVFTKVLAAELARDGVTVNAVAPAAIGTPVMDALGEERIAQIAASIPVRRLGTSEEVAATVRYLCRPAAGFVTGTTVDVNGGLHMR